MEPGTIKGRAGPGRGSRTARILAIATALAVVALSPVVADAKKKKKQPASTQTAATALTAGGTASATASCKGKTHATGGGLSVSPGFTPPSTGLRTLPLLSTPSGSKGWNASAGAHTSPAGSGTLTSFVRCERNSVGKIALRSSSSIDLPSSTGGNILLNCPPGTHVISGGYTGDGPSNLAAIGSFRIIVLQSRRTGPTQWTVSGYNRTGAPASTLSGHVVCELNAKGGGVSEVSQFASTVNDARTEADASCSKKKHVVSGGFLVSPATFPGTVPLVGIDENHPSGKRGWHVGLYEYPGASLPAGSALQTVAYCKKG